MFTLKMVKTPFHLSSQDRRKNKQLYWKQQYWRERDTHAEVNPRILIQETVQTLTEKIW